MSWEHRRKSTKPHPLGTPGGTVSGSTVSALRPRKRAREWRPLAPASRSQWTQRSKTSGFWTEPWVMVISWRGWNWTCTTFCIFLLYIVGHGGTLRTLKVDAEASVWPQFVGFIQLTAASLLPCWGHTNGCAAQIGRQSTLCVLGSPIKMHTPHPLYLLLSSSCNICEHPCQHSLLSGHL